MSDDERVMCYACTEPIEPDDWVIPLETYRAAYSGEEFVLDADRTCETVIHARCLGYD